MRSQRLTLLAAASPLLLAARLAGVAVAQPTTSCEYAYGGSTYNLAGLTRRTDTTGYSVADVRDISTAYVFNVCQNVQTPTSITCTASGTAATAWQLQYGTGVSGTCYQLGQSVQQGGWNFSIYDPMYPARGVMLQYQGGNSKWCPGNRPRTLTLEVTCSPGTPITYDYTSASVYETNTCDYHVELPSVLGCPTQCLTGSSVCNGNGVCGFNDDSGNSQCYCYNGFGGTNCDTTVSNGGLSAEGVILIIVCIALAGVIGLVVFMFFKLRRLQVDPAAYGELEGKFNELGMLA